MTELVKQKEFLRLHGWSKKIVKVFSKKTYINKWILLRDNQSPKCIKYYV